MLVLDTVSKQCALQAMVALQSQLAQHAGELRASQALVESMNDRVQAAEREKEEAVAAARASLVANHEAQDVAKSLEREIARLSAAQESSAKEQEDSRKQLDAAATAQRAAELQLEHVAHELNLLKARASRVDALTADLATEREAKATAEYQVRDLCA